MSIRIHATTDAVEDVCTRADSGIYGFSKPRRPILGWYLAGEIEAVGTAVRKYKVVDQVYGSSNPWFMGTYAEYLCMPEDGAAVPNGGLTVLPFLQNKGSIQQAECSSTGLLARWVRLPCRSPRLSARR
ncbi:MAG: alcohol dehydrogenase catalytic domain-containing protein [Anaerolineae bacterium]